MGTLGELTAEEKQKLGMGTREKHSNMNSKFKLDYEAIMSEKIKAKETETSEKVVPPYFNEPKSAFTAWLITKADPPMTIEEASTLDMDSPKATELKDKFTTFIVDNSVRVKKVKRVTAYTTEITKMLVGAEKIINDYKLPNIDYTNKDEYLTVADTLSELNYLADEVTRQFTQSSGFARPYIFDERVGIKTSKIDENSFDIDLQDVIDPHIPKQDQFKQIQTLQSRLSSNYNLLETIDEVYEKLEYRNPVRILATRHQLNSIKGKPLGEASKLNEKINDTAHQIQIVTDSENSISENRILDRLMGEKDTELDELVQYKNAKGMAISLKLKADMTIGNHEKSIVSHYKNLKKAQERDGNTDFKLMNEVMGSSVKNGLDSAIGAKTNLFLGDNTNTLQQIINGIQTFDGLVRLTNEKRDINAGTSQKSVVIKDIYPTMIYVHQKINKDGNSEFESANIFEQMEQANKQILENVNAMKEYLDNRPPYITKVIENKPEWKAMNDDMIKTLENAEKMALADQHFLDKIRGQNLKDMTLSQLKNGYKKDCPEAYQQSKSLDEKLTAFEKTNRRYASPTELGEMFGNQKTIPVQKQEIIEEPNNIININSLDNENQINNIENNNNEIRFENINEINVENKIEEPDNKPGNIVIEGNEPKIEEKKDEPKIEEKEDVPKVEDKKDEPKVEDKKDEPKVEEKVRILPVQNIIAKPTVGVRLDKKVWYNKKDNILRADKRIEALQNKVKLQADGPTYDQMIELLAVRAAVDAKRNTKSSLKKDVFDYEVADMKDKLRNNDLLKSFYNKVKAEPSDWHKVKTSFQMGHGGMIEDTIKFYSNMMPLKSIPQDDLTTGRFLPRVKDRIEYWQNVVKKGECTDLKTASTEILIARNMAEARRDDKSSLDKRITKDMLKLGSQHEKALLGDDLKGNDKLYNVLNEYNLKTFKDLITTGHGGKLCEVIRNSTDRREFTQEKDLNHALYGNTIKGAALEVTNKIKRLEKSATDILQKLDGPNAAEDKRVLQSELNTFFPELVAQAVVIAEMTNEARATADQVGLRTDFNKAEFRNRVAQMKADPNFERTYQEFIKPGSRPNEFTIKGISTKFAEAKQKMENPNTRPRRNAVVQRGNEGPAMNN